MTLDTRALISACPMCGRGKSYHQPLVGLLNPLLTPRLPWSHITVDFVTGLSPSDRDITILTVVDRFSKIVHFILLHPSSCFILVFLVSVWRPEFTRYGGPSALGASVTLSSGYYPCLTAQHPASWSSFLLWVKYAHNSLVLLPLGCPPSWHVLVTSHPCCSRRRRWQYP